MPAVLVLSRYLPPILGRGKVRFVTRADTKPIRFRTLLRECWTSPRRRIEGGMKPVRGVFFRSRLTSAGTDRHQPTSAGIRADIERRNASFAGRLTLLTDPRLSAPHASKARRIRGASIDESVFRTRADTRKTSKSTFFLDRVIPFH